MDKESKTTRDYLEGKFLFLSNFPSTGIGIWVSSERITQIPKYEREQMSDRAVKRSQLEYNRNFVLDWTKLIYVRLSCLD